MLSFNQWMENQVLGGGLEPPKQDPTKVGQGAFQTYFTKNSDELPPDKIAKKRRSAINKLPTQIGMPLNF